MKRTWKIDVDTKNHAYTFFVYRNTDDEAKVIQSALEFGLFQNKEDALYATVQEITGTPEAENYLMITIDLEYRIQNPERKIQAESNESETPLEITIDNILQKHFNELYSHKESIIEEVVETLFAEHSKREKDKIMENLLYCTDLRKFLRKSILLACNIEPLKTDRELKHDEKILRDSTHWMHLSRQEKIDELWVNLEKGFCPYQTMPGYDAFMYGNKEKGIIIETTNDYPSSGAEYEIDYKICKPEHFEKVYDALLQAYEQFYCDMENYEILDKFFKETDSIEAEAVRMDVTSGIAKN